MVSLAVWDCTDQVWNSHGACIYIWTTSHLKTILDSALDLSQAEPILRSNTIHTKDRPLNNANFETWASSHRNNARLIPGIINSRL